MPKSSSPATKSENSFWKAEVQLQGPELQLAPKTHACLRRTKPQSTLRSAASSGPSPSGLGFLPIWVLQRQKCTIPGESQVSRKWGTFALRNKPAGSRNSKRGPSGCPEQGHPHSGGSSMAPWISGSLQAKNKNLQSAAPDRVPRTPS